MVRFYSRQHPKPMIRNRKPVQGASRDLEYLSTCKRCVRQGGRDLSHWCGVWERRSHVRVGGVEDSGAFVGRC
jgi:hypothetical protein